MLLYSLTKYAPLMQKGSPVALLSQGEFQLPYKKLYYANGRLTHHRPTSQTGNALYSNRADATGMAETATLARVKCISECLERWAFWESNANGFEKYGYNHCNNTNGLSAYPTIRANKVRFYSQKEAVERWALNEWWLGSLKCVPTQICSYPFDVFEIIIPWKEFKVVILREKWAEKRWVFGYGCGQTLNHAIESAESEHYRTRYLLEQHQQENPNFTNKEIKNLQSVKEKRMLYYSYDPGNQRFEANLEKEVGIPKKPNTLVDKEIVGEWSKYARVWRLLYESNYGPMLADNKPQFFSW